MTVPGVLGRIDLLVPLLAAHVLADFVLQTDAMAAAKGRRPKLLLAHGAVVALASWVLLGHGTGALPLVLSVSILHVLIDGAKATVERMTLAPDAPDVSLTAAPGSWRRNGRAVLFLGDQALHALSLVAAVWAVGRVPLVANPPVDAGVWMTTLGSTYLRLLVLASGWVVATTAVGYFFAGFLARFEAELEPDQRGGLTKGGYWIGVTERSLIYLFILVGEPAGIGFLAAAKSVFRIGELRESKDRKLAEYILIGTLMSFAAAMLVGLLTRSALSWVG